MIEGVGTFPHGQIVHWLHLQGDGLEACILTLGAIVPNSRMHGGAQGSVQQAWQVVGYSPASVTLASHKPHDALGFPDLLDFDIRAQSDRDAICSFSHHGYFALIDSGSLARHRLKIAADHFFQVDDTLTMVGDIAPLTVEFDYRVSQALRDSVPDHDYFLSALREALRPTAWLTSDLSGLQMRLETAEPGHQVYIAAHLPAQDAMGHDGRHLERHAEVALEPQIWPDAANRAHFPSALLRGGQRYQHQSLHVVSSPEPVR